MTESEQREREHGLARVRQSLHWIEMVSASASNERIRQIAGLMRVIAADLQATETEMASLRAKKKGKK
jgi:hypothetical protein